jgi:hypothetical protein
MTKKYLANKIEKKLDQLQKLVEEIGNHDIHPNDREM